MDFFFSFWCFTWIYYIVWTQLQQFDCELQPLKEVLVEYPVTFPPSYPYEEDPALPQNYMFTRCPAWCDRILMSPDAKNLINDNNFSSLHYNTIGNDVCMGDHKVKYTFHSIDSIFSDWIFFWRESTKLICQMVFSLSLIHEEKKTFKIEN